MKKLFKVEEVQGEGLIALMGENVTLFCMNYIYHGKLVGVNDKFVLLENAGIVYETGSFTENKFKDFQKVPNNLYVLIHTIESFTVLNKE